MRSYLVALVIAGCHAARPVAPAPAAIAGAPAHHAPARADVDIASRGPLAEMIQTGHEPCAYVPERREPPPGPGPIRGERRISTMPSGCPRDPMLPPGRPLRY